MKYLISGISLPFWAEESEFIQIAKNKMKRAASAALFRFCVYKKSIDARKKNDIKAVCSVMAETKEVLSRATEDKLLSLGIVRLAVQGNIPIIF